MFEHVQDLEATSVKRPPLTRKRRLEIGRETGDETAGDGAEICNLQIRRPPSPRRHPCGGRHPRIRHRRQVRRLQGRCCEFPLPLPYICTSSSDLSVLSVISMLLESNLASTIVSVTWNRWIDSRDAALSSGKYTILYERLNLGSQVAYPHMEVPTYCQQMRSVFHMFQFCPSNLRHTLSDVPLHLLSRRSWRLEFRV